MAILFQRKHQNIEDGWLDRFFEKEDLDYLDFWTSGFSQSWEARYAVVQNYVEIVNQLTGRNTQLSLNEVKKHWRRKLVLPMEICGDLTNEEYALLIERLPPELLSKYRQKQFDITSRLFGIPCTGICGKWLRSQPGHKSRLRFSDI